MKINLNNRMVKAVLNNNNRLLNQESRLVLWEYPRMKAKKIKSLFILRKMKS